MKTFYKLLIDNGNDEIILFTIRGDAFLGEDKIVSQKVRRDDNVEEIELEDLCRFNKDTREKFIDQLTQNVLFNSEIEPYSKIYIELKNNDRVYPLMKYSKLLNGNPVHIATVDEKNNPNISVASDVFVLNDDIILIAANDFINTVKNIKLNNKVVLSSLDKYWNGLRIFGIADYIESGEYYDSVVEKFADERTNPLGAIVIKIEKYELLS